MNVFNSSKYRIDQYLDINRNRPFALDVRIKSDVEHFVLINIGWYETLNEAYQAMNQHMESGFLGSTMV